MKSRHNLQLVLVAFLMGVSSAYAVGEELVEKMPIKSIHKDTASAAQEGQADISTSKVMMRQVPLGHAIVLAFPHPFTRASVANPDVAETIVLSPTQLYLSGKTLGYTTLTLWDKEKQISAVLELVVHLPIVALRHNLSALFPMEKDVAITTAHEHIVLSGQVSSTEIKDKIGRVAGAYAPLKVLNFLKLIDE